VVLRGGWFNRFLDKPASAGKLGMTRAALGMTLAALGMTKTGDGNLAHSAPLRTCFGWGVREISNFKFQIADCKFQISAFAGTSFRLRGKDDFRLRISDTELRGHKFQIEGWV